MHNLIIARSSHQQSIQPLRHLRASVKLLTLSGNFICINKLLALSGYGKWCMGIYLKFENLNPMSELNCA